MITIIIYIVYLVVKHMKVVGLLLSFVIHRDAVLIYNYERQYVPVRLRQRHNRWSCLRYMLQSYFLLPVSIVLFLTLILMVVI